MPGSEFRIVLLPSVVCSARLRTAFGEAVVDEAMGEMRRGHLLKELE